MQSELPISGSHPTTVRYYEWAAHESALAHDDAPRPRAVIQLIHGMVEHLGRYAPLAEYLSEQGYTVVGADHRGHGLSANSRNPLGYFGDGVQWDDLVEDIHAVRTYVSQRYPGIPYVMFGHSMGSFLLRTYLMRHSSELAGAAIVGTGLWPGTIATVGRTLARILSALRPRGTAHLLNALAFGPYNKPFEHRTPSDWLSRNQENVDAYIADPLSGFVPSNAFFLQLLNGIQTANVERTFHLPPDVPLYIASGELDPVGGARAVRSVAAHYSQAGSHDVTTHIYPHDRHEIFNETDKDQVWADFAQWLARVTA